MSTELVTGATGMLGSALVLELLAGTDSVIHCLVRAADAATADRRLWESLLRTAGDHDRERDLDSHRASSRLRAVPGDIGTPGCGLAIRGRIDRVWHSAASLRYEPGFARQTHHDNVTGTANVIAVTQEFDADLVHVSTAYVAGTRTGRQHEVLPDAGQPVNNAYEHAKVAAEHLVAESGLRWRIVRPSAVVANSRTLRTSFGSGVYNLAEKVARFRRQYERRYGEVIRQRPVRLCGDEHAEINLVPLDQVVSNAFRVAIDGPPGSIFHLTNATASTVREVYDTAFTHAGLMPPEYVPDPLDLDVVDRLLCNTIAFHYPYTVAPKWFDRTNTEAVTGQDATRFTASTGVITQLLRGHSPQPARYSTLNSRGTHVRAG